MKKAIDIKGCIFDMDGVLTDTAELHFKSWKRFANQFGFKIPDELNNRLKGLSRPDSLQIILEYSNQTYSDEAISGMMKLKNELFLEEVEEFNESDRFPGALDFIVELQSESIPYALASGSRNAVIILEKIGLKQYFEVLLDGNSVKTGKPDPQIFIKAAGEMGVEDRSKIVVFEDSVAGLSAALKGGFLTVGFGSGSELKKLAHFTIDNWQGVNLKYIRQRFFELEGAIGD